MFFFNIFHITLFHPKCNRVIEHPWAYLQLSFSVNVHDITSKNLSLELELVHANHAGQVHVVINKMEVGRLTITLVH